VADLEVNVTSPSASSQLLEAPSSRIRGARSHPDGRRMRELLVEALRALDVRLSKAAEATVSLFGPDASRDLFRGLHITPADARATLRRAPGATLFGPLGDGGSVVAQATLRGTRFERLAQLFALAPFDVDVMLVGLAPEIDVRYERLYAFVQDDVAKKRPTLDLVLNLLCESIEDRLSRLRHFGAGAPLVRHGLVAIGGEGSEVPRLSRTVRVDESVLRFLLGHVELDARLAACCELLQPERSAGAPRSRRPSRSDARRLPFYVRGIDEGEIRDAVRSQFGDRTILAVDVERAPRSAIDWSALISLVLREGRMYGHVLSFERIDGLFEPDQAHRLRVLLTKVNESRVEVVLSGASVWRAPDSSRSPIIPLELVPARPAERRAEWERLLADAGSAAAPAALEAVAQRFILGPSQVANAVTVAVHRSRVRGAMRPERDDLFDGARAQTRAQLAGLAHLIESRSGWADLIVPASIEMQLREIQRRVAHQGRVLGDWGFDKKLSYGKGTGVLFAGPSGTGKTMAAGIIARDLGLDLYRIDLSCVVSKYIGETAKNLSQVFAVKNGVLLLDEADALAGKRTEIHDAHDRYANQDIAYLLQRIEEFEGLVILTTNLPGSIDGAFRRRLAMTVYFPQPDEISRRRLWERTWPAAAPVGPDVDNSVLAAQFKVSGGVITNAALAAAYLAAEDGPPISMRHVLHALQRELSAVGSEMPGLPESVGMWTR